MIVAIHQPESFPWLGFFHKMYLADVFVILDTVQFKREDVQNRNKILIGRWAGWLTIPIFSHPLNTKIKDIKINWNNPKIFKRHLTTIQQTYSKHPHFEELFNYMGKLYARRYENLVDFNLDLIVFLKDKLGIQTKVVKASELPLSGRARGGTEVTLEICKLLGADTYLSGAGAKVYLDADQYSKEGIKVYFQEFKHPKYEQRGVDEFVSHLSVLDLYFNHGPKSLAVILTGNLRSLEP